MRRPLITLTVFLAAVAVAYWMYGGRGVRNGGPAIVVEGGRVIVENQTAETWTSVRVTVNSYYTSGTSRLVPGGRLEGPLDKFVTGSGRFFNAAGESVRTVEVRASTESGTPVRLDWP